MKNGTATYSPEDNKLRLYVGRVPRDEYEKLRAEGWTSTPKQTCDFVATWTPERRDTCLEYADLIEDEDQGPEDRAADRAERFSEYRDKRTGEATGYADNYDAGPMAHGYQSAARAERCARRHDRIGGYACDAWSKAEYWQRRTAGVISHALYKSTPGVRMGRIKVLEAELRRLESRTDARGIEWANHTKLRLAYENQMIEAQGGRLAAVDIEPGGKLGSKLIVKVNKSNATGRVVSVSILGPRVEGWAYKTRNIPGTEFAEYQFDTERLAPGAYTPPTDESRAELADFNKARKAAAPKKDPCPLINPTDSDAERLQALFNECAKADLAARKARGAWAEEYEPKEVVRITQAHYSAKAKGSYACAETRGIFRGGIECDSYYRAAEKMREKYGREVCQIRRTSGGNYQASRVIVLTDKPQKPLPAAVWQKPILAALVNANESFV